MRFLQAVNANVFRPWLFDQACLARLVRTYLPNNTGYPPASWEGFVGGVKNQEPKSQKDNFEGKMMRVGFEPTHLSILEDLVDRMESETALI